MAKWHTLRVPLGRRRQPPAPAGRPRRGRARARTRASAGRSRSAVPPRSRATDSGVSTPLGGGPAASTASAWAISTPPEEGGGLVTNVRSRYGSSSGRRRMARYAARSAAVRLPPVAAWCATSACAVSPSASSRAPCAAMRSSVSASGGLLVRSPACSGAADGPKIRAPSGEAPRKPVSSWITSACAAVISTPAARERDRGALRARPTAAGRGGGALPRARPSRPARRTIPGRPGTSAGPVPKSTMYGSSGATSPACPAPGTAVKKSSASGRRRAASKATRKPPPPGPVSAGSATHEANAAATHASTAEPPARRISAPTSAVAGCPAAIAPRAGAQGSPSRAGTTGRRDRRRARARAAASGRASARARPCASRWRADRTRSR